MSSLLPESKFIKRVSVLKCNLPFVDAVYEYGGASIGAGHKFQYCMRIVMRKGIVVREFKNTDYSALLREVDEFLEGEQARFKEEYVIQDI